MVAAALADGTASRQCVFEVFARRLPDGRRYGVVAGTGRLLEAISRFRFGDAGARGAGRASSTAARSTGSPTTGSPATSTATPRASCTSPARRSSRSPARSPTRVMLETLALSILNHDSAVASAAARMVTAAAGRPIIEMGSRRTHEEAAVAAARAAYLAGFAATSNLEAERRHGIPTAGTAAHACVLLHDDEQDAFESQVKALGADDHAARRHLRHPPGHRARRARRPGRGSARCASTRATSASSPARPASSSTRSARPAPRSCSPATSTSTRSPRCAPSPSTPTASARRWSPARARRPRAWSTSWSRSTGDRWPSAARRRSRAAARKSAVRRFKPTGTAIEEVVHAAATPPAVGPHDRVVPVPLMRGGELGARPGDAGAVPRAAAGGAGRRCRGRG